MKTLNGPALTELQIEQYLARIGIAKAKEPTPEFLAELHYAHISHVPFENIDVMKGVEVSLDREHLFEKIILGGRGGICSELNTLYNWLLESLGFDVVSYISRIIAKSAPVQPNSHRVLAVRFDGDGDTCGSRQLTDVGYNYSHYRKPIWLEEGKSFDDGDCCYEMIRDSFRGWIQNQKTAEGWRQQLSFNESPQIDLDFVTPTYFAQHHPNSKINKFTKVSLHKDGEFYAIREGIFLTEKHGVVRELEELKDPARETELIRDFFGINI